VYQGQALLADKGGIDNAVVAGCGKTGVLVELLLLTPISTGGKHSS
jgi:hypothetical protein